jgi:hypothetical protein
VTKKSPAYESGAAKTCEYQETGVAVAVASTLGNDAGIRFIIG